MAHYWMTFVDGSRPDSDKFLGACVVEAFSFEDALGTSHILGINPGGEVRIIEISDEHLPPLLKYKDRLVGKAELNEGGCFSRYDRDRFN